MPKFRKKLVVIEAEQYKASEDGPRGVCHEPKCHVDGLSTPHVHTIHGQPIQIEDGDWILPEPDGKHFYPCKDYIFKDTYEPVRSSFKGFLNEEGILEEVEEAAAVKAINILKDALAAEIAKVAKLKAELEEE